VNDVIDLTITFIGTSKGMADFYKIKYRLIYLGMSIAIQLCEDIIK